MPVPLAYQDTPQQDIIGMLLAGGQNQTQVPYAPSWNANMAASPASPSAPNSMENVDTQQAATVSDMTNNLGQQIDSLAKEFKKLYTDSIAKRQKGIQEARNMQSMIAQSMISPQLDLSPLVALAEAESGKKLMQGYTKPQGPMEQINQVAKLRQQIQSEEQGITQDQIAMMQQRLGLLKEKQQVDYQNKLLGVAKQKAGMTAKPGQRVMDSTFAKDWVNYKTNGFTLAQKQLSQIRMVRDALATESGLSGTSTGLMGKFGRSIFNKRAQAIQDTLHEVVQSDLRPTLGAAFTEKEGMMLMDRAFDPYQPQAENLKRVDRLYKKMQAAVNAKMDAGTYYDDNGTLSGYKGKIYDATDFSNNSLGFNKKESSVDKGNLKGHDKEAYDWAIANPDDPRSQKIIDNLGGL